MSLGASISFFTVFSLAPMLLAAISVAGLLFGRQAAQGAVVAELGGLAGDDAAQAIDAMIANVSIFGTGAIGAVIGVVTFLILATGAFVEIQDSLNLIWKAKPSHTGILAFLRTRVLSLALVIGIGFLLLVSLVLDAGLGAAGAYLEGAFPAAVTMLGILNSLVALVMATLLFAAIFKVLPDVRLAWRDVWTGAFVTGVAFTLGKVLIGLYIGRSGVASTFGAAASVITILLWIYYSSLILLFGAEFTKAYAETHGSRVGRHGERREPAE
jgi:membrane protein